MTTREYTLSEVYVEAGSLGPGQHGNYKLPYGVDVNTTGMAFGLASVYPGRIFQVTFFALTRVLVVERVQLFPKPFLKRPRKRTRRR